MKKKEFKRSELSARERKELRRQNEAKAQGIVSEDEKEYKEKKAKIYFVLFLIVAVILISTGIAVPTYMSCNYMFERNPVAVIKLDAGGKTFEMKYELFVTDCPRATANFVFLAQQDFFDGVVIYDTQNDWMRFGGYTEGEDSDGNLIFNHRSDDSSFTDRLTSNFKEAHYTKTQTKDGEQVTVTDTTEALKYTLKKDDTSFSYIDFDYALCANVSGSSASATEFQINGLNKAREDKLTKADGTSAKTMTTQVFARPLGESNGVKEAIEYVLGMEKGDRVGDYFVTTSTLVKITDVSVYNYETEWLQVKYENGFEDYMTEIGGFSYTSDTWSNSHISGK